MKSRLLGAVFAVILTGTAQAEESYLCVSDLATGFTYEKESGWRQANFAVNTKYVVKIPGNDDQGLYYGEPAFIVIEVGDKFAKAGCENGFNEYGNLFCAGWTSFKFNMNKETLSFITFFDFGYLTFEKHGEQVDDVAIQIGKCSRL